MKGDIVTIAFPFSDLSGSKKRPALVIADWGGEDLILCQITSKAKKDGFEIELDSESFSSGSLPILSNVRPNKIFTASKTSILDTKAHISENKYNLVYDKLLSIFKP